MIGQKHILSFAELTVIEEGIAELIVNHGEEVTLDMLMEYYNLCLSLFKGPFSLLVNKINTYSYTFEAQHRIPVQEMIHATAVVTYNQMAKMGTSFLSNFEKEQSWNMQMFNNRDTALAWLTDQHASLTNQPGY
jgi:hypothetical protein